MTYLSKQIHSASLLIILTLTSPLYSEEINSVFLENQNLKEQVSKQNRYLPSGKDYSAGLDMFFWKDGGELYYHGIGSWVDAFFELRPRENWHINLNYTHINGTISDGHRVGDFDFFSPSAYWAPTENLRGRILDLGRVTYGAGLIVEDREAEGGYIEYQNGQHFFKAAITGTGVIFNPTDLYFLNYQWQQESFKMGLAKYYFYDPSNNLSETPHLTSLYVQSRKNSALLLSVEGGINQKSLWDSKAALGVQNLEDCRFCFKLYPQYRNYSDAYPNTHYDYVPYDLVQRNFVNSMNLINPNSRVSSLSLHFDFDWRIGEYLKYNATNEYVKTEGGVQRYENGAFWYRHTLSLCPYKEFKDSCLGAFVSNKELNAFSPQSLSNPRFIYGDKDNFNIGVEINMHL